MTTATKNRPGIRKIAAWSVAGLLAVTGTLAFEQTGGSATPAPKESNAPTGQTGNGNGKQNGHVDPDTGLPRHCTDGHGQDGVHNPHCQPSQ